MTDTTDITAELDRISMQVTPLRDALYALGDKLYRMGRLLAPPPYPYGPLPIEADPAMSIDTEQARTLAASIGELGNLVAELHRSIIAQHTATPRTQ